MVCCFLDQPEIGFCCFSFNRIHFHESHMVWDLRTECKCVCGFAVMCGTCLAPGTRKMSHEHLRLEMRLIISEPHWICCKPWSMLWRKRLPRIGLDTLDLSRPTHQRVFTCCWLSWVTAVSEYCVDQQENTEQLCTSLAPKRTLQRKKASIIYLQGFCYDVSAS